VFGDQSGATVLAAAILGGTLAAGAHFAKSGTRALINTSPEPFSNWAASLSEDFAVGALLWVAFAHPLVALIVVALLVAFLLWLIPRIWRAGRRIIAGVSGSLARLRRAGVPRDSH